MTYRHTNALFIFVLHNGTVTEYCTEYMYSQDTTFILKTQQYFKLKHYSIARNDKIYFNINNVSIWIFAVAAAVIAPVSLVNFFFPLCSYESPVSYIPFGFKTANRLNNWFVCVWLSHRIHTQCIRNEYYSISWTNEHTRTYTHTMS